MKIYKIKVNGKYYKVELKTMASVKLINAIEEVASETIKEVKKEEVKKAVSTGEGTEVLAPIQGNVVDVKVSVGTKVKKGQVLLLIEAMKLENEVLSPVDGEVSEILVSKGKTVANKELLIKIK